MPYHALRSTIIAFAESISVFIPCEIAVIAQRFVLRVIIARYHVKFRRENAESRIHESESFIIKFMHIQYQKLCAVYTELSQNWKSGNCQENWIWSGKLRKIEEFCRIFWKIKILNYKEILYTYITQYSFEIINLTIKHASSVSNININY